MNTVTEKIFNYPFAGLHDAYVIKVSVLQFSLSYYKPPKEEDSDNFYFKVQSPLKTSKLTLQENIKQGIFYKYSTRTPKKE